MALLILAGLQMIPSDIYEAAEIDGVHPVKVFWQVTLPLIRPALMVAVIFRGLDALRIFDLIYVLTPNNVQTKIDVGLSPARICSISTSSPTAPPPSTLLFLIIALLTIALHLARQGKRLRGRHDDRADSSGARRSTCWSPSSSSSRCSRSITPSSRLKSGTALFEVDLLAEARSPSPTTSPCSPRAAFPRNIAELAVRRRGRRSLSRCSSASPPRTRWRACASAAGGSCSSPSCRCRCSRRSRCLPACSS